MTKEIYTLLFNFEIPDNLQVSELIKSQFNETFSKIDGLKQWFKEQQFDGSSKGGSESPLHSHMHLNQIHSNQSPLRILSYGPIHQRIITPQPSPKQTPPQPDQHQHQETPPHFKNFEPKMPSEHSDDSLATVQWKKDWRVAKFAKQIWREHGFDTTMDKSLINSWVNPTQRLLDDDYKPYLMYAEPPSNGYWDIPISPNSKFFTVFEPFDLSLPDDQRLPLEFELLNQFHAKHGYDFKNIWSNDRPEAVKNYKVRMFMRTDFVQYTLTWRRPDYIRTQVDFPCMKPKEVFLIVRVFQVKSDKHPNMKIAYEKACEFLKSLVYDFEKIDTDIHPVLAKKFNFPELESASSFTEGYQEMSLGATNLPQL